MRARALLASVSWFVLAACSRSNEATSTRVHPIDGAMASSDHATAAPPTPHVAHGPDTLSTSQGDLRIVPIHHATVLFELGGKEYYVDPFHEGNLDGRPPADVIFITHAHPDHFDPSAIEKIRKPGTIIVCPPSVAEKLEPRDHPGDSTGVVVVLKNGESRTVAGVGVEAFAMYNLKRGPVPGKVFHEKGWGEGFVLTFGDKRVYVSGDTECTPEMRDLKDIDVAFVCMNLPYTMTPREAGECVEAFKPKVLYPYHYRDSDLGELDKVLAKDKDIEVRKRDWY
jgi:L-ascorbate metabolism protein UlaG (beta-lactamase superfamily)